MLTQEMPKHLVKEFPRMEYLASYPKHEPEDGRVIVHNHVRPQRILGRNGFRAWLDELSPEHVECSCSRSKLKHYRMKKYA